MPDDRGEIRYRGLRLPLGPWSRGILVGLLIVVAGGISYQSVFHDIIHPDTTTVPIEDLLQMEESMRHFGQTPEKSVLLDGATVSSWADECISTTRQWGDSWHVYFDLHPSRTFEKDDARSTVDIPVTHAGILATLDGGGTCEGRCLPDPHPGRWREWYERINQCIVMVYREWADGCVHRQPYDECYGRWGPVEWLCCVH